MARVAVELEVNGNGRTPRARRRLDLHAALLGYALVAATVPAVMIVRTIPRARAWKMLGPAGQARQGGLPGAGEVPSLEEEQDLALRLHPHRRRRD